MTDASTVQLLVVAAAGGIGGNLLTTATRRVEFRREDRARWLMHREEAYTALLSSTVSAISALSSGVPLENEGDTLDQLALSLGRVLLLAPEPVRERARDLYDETLTYLGALYAKRTDNEMQGDPGAYRSAARAFREVARANLGVDESSDGRPWVSGWLATRPWRSLLPVGRRQKPQVRAPVPPEQEP